MVVIHSKQDFDITTEAVIDWLDYLGQPWLRLNGEDANGPAALRLDLEAGELCVGGQRVPLAEVRAVWYRRGGQLLSGLPWLPTDAHRKLDFYLREEAKTLREALPSLLGAAVHVDHPRHIALNKLAVLQRAQAAGLRIPRTLITNNRHDALTFGAECGSLITKSIAETHDFVVEGQVFIVQTQQLDPATLPETFFPTLLQQQLDKEYELRVFFLAGSCHAAAIFSQADAQTRVDFRNYNAERPNRVVPYQLPPAVAAAIGRLMDGLHLSNGSLDLVRTTAGEYVFLEVNPTGQFGMVSAPCNYYLERHLAEFLTKQAHAAASPGPSAHG